MKNRRQSPEINAGSMADIAFLLLIFFLVSTQILNEQGVKVFLPKYSETLPKPGKTNKKILKILINEKDELLVNGSLAAIEDLQDRVVQFISNPDQLESLPPTPDRALISIDTHDRTSYDQYINVYSEIKNAYLVLWKETALNQYNKPILSLTKEEQMKIKKMIPLNISEIEKL